MGYVIATNIDNTILRAHFAFMAFRGGVSIEGLRNATRIIEPDDDLSAEEVRFSHLSLHLVLSRSLCSIMYGGSQSSSPVC